MSGVTIPKSDIRLATWASTLYILNLLLLPGLAFLILVYLYFRHRESGSKFVRDHLRQNLLAMIASGFAIVGISVMILLLGGFDSPWTWMALILYGLTIHATLVLLGVLSVVKASNGEVYTYPLLGRF